MNAIGFDNDKYLKLQSEKIKERIDFFGGKLYLEFGGKLFDDFHASRVLPGFKPDSKLKMLLQIKDKAEIVIVISAESIQCNKIRGDLNITYDQDVLRLMDAFEASGMFVGSVVLTQYKNQPLARAFRNKLEKQGIKVYRHYHIDGYPYDVKKIVSESGYGQNEYIQTSRPLVIVTAPGPGSGKMATCLSQLYHDHKHGISSGYAKFETFPIWNLPLRHPVNIAYEAATSDLNDVNMIDPFHLEAYGTMTVNYNRDVEIFPVLNNMFEQIFGSSPYKSPTDMGVNMAGYCITDDEVVRQAAQQEIIRRYYSALKARLDDKITEESLRENELLMKKAGVSIDDRKVIASALKKEKLTGAPAAAIQLNDGTIITGRTTSLLGASSALVLNALKFLGGIPDSVLLLSPDIIEPIRNLKINNLGNHNPRLHTDEILIALSICALTDENAKKAMEQLPNLRGSEMHSSVILSPVDYNVIKKLGINLTCEAKYQSKKLYH